MDYLHSLHRILPRTLFASALVTSAALTTGCIQLRTLGDDPTSTDSGGDEGEQCADGDTMPSEDGCNTCVCHDGGWACTARGCGDGGPGPTCENGETMPAPDGCNTCVCSEGYWACTQRGCAGDDGAVCEDGDVMDAPDGCNTCSCFDGQWACTEIGCGDGGVVCEAGTVKVDSDGCNTCSCEGGQWACSNEPCPSCAPGESMEAPDGCNTCDCVDGGWVCTDEACPADFCADFGEEECAANNLCMPITIRPLEAQPGSSVLCVGTRSQHAGCVSAAQGCGEAETVWCDDAGDPWLTPTTCGTWGLGSCNPAPEWEYCD